MAKVNKQSFFLFYKLLGTIEDIFPDAIGVVCHGVGYYVHATQQTLSQVSIGVSVPLYIEHLFRQDSSQILVGFLNSTEQESFKLLMTVQGVGMKSALSILSLYDANQLIQIIAAQDVKSLSKADGIGKKTAERILLELKNKLKDIPIVTTSSFNTEALEVLEALGFSRAESLRHLQAIKEPMPTEQLVQYALKQFGR